MAEHADPSRVSKIRPGARATYPWGSWSDGEWWRLREGADYATTTTTFQSVARSWARRNCFRLETQLTEDGTFVRFTNKQ